MQQTELAASYEARQVTLNPFAHACGTASPRIGHVRIDRPEFLGCACWTVPLDELIPFIDWSPFFLAWELKGKYPQILEDPTWGTAARELYANTHRLLARMFKEQ